MKKPTTKADLKRKIKELEAQLAHGPFFATQGLKKPTGNTAWVRQSFSS